MAELWAGWRIYISVLFVAILVRFCSPPQHNFDFGSTFIYIPILKIFINSLKVGESILNKCIVKFRFSPGVSP